MQLRRCRPQLDAPSAAGVPAHGAGLVVPQPAVFSRAFLNLQSPIGDWTGLLVRLLDVGLGDGEIDIDHLEAGMAKQALESKNVAAVAQELDGKGVAEAVDVDATDSGTAAELYPSGDLPPRLAAKLGDLVWCDHAGDYVELADPARVVLTPEEA